MKPWVLRVRVLCYQAAIPMRCVSRVARAEFAFFTRLCSTGGTADLLCGDFAFHGTTIVPLQRR